MQELRLILLSLTCCVTIVTKCTIFVMYSCAVYIRMFHNFTFFEIKYAWGLIKSDFGHNEEINFFLIIRCFEGVPRPQSLIFLNAEKF